MPMATYATRKTTIVGPKFLLTSEKLALIASTGPSPWSTAKNSANIAKNADARGRRVRT